MRQRLTDQLRLTHHAARIVGGRWFWLAALLPLLWLGFQYISVILGWRPRPTKSSTRKTS